MTWYVSARPDGVVGCGIVVSFYDIPRVCAFVYMAYSVVDHVLTNVFHSSLGPIRVVASSNVLYFDSFSSDTI